jgi:L,D-transpeptidase ErfK/SrfK
MQVTHGCVRMFPEDIEFLFDLVPVGTTVRIINEPVKIGWDGDSLVMEVHPVLVSNPAATTDVPVQGASADALDAAGAPAAEGGTGFAAPAKDPLTYATEQFIVATAERNGELDWTLVEAAIVRSDGMPVVVGEGLKNAATSAASE